MPERLVALLRVEEPGPPAKVQMGDGRGTELKINVLSPGLMVKGNV
jgi:hypothetical protein